MNIGYALVNHFGVLLTLKQVILKVLIEICTPLTISAAETVIKHQNVRDTVRKRSGV